MKGIKINWIIIYIIKRTLINYSKNKIICKCTLLTIYENIFNQ